MTDRPIAAEIAALRKLDILALSARYHDLFGRPPRSKNPDTIWRRCAWKIQADRHGGLSDAAKAKLAELQESIELPVEVQAVLPKERLPVGRVITREWRNQQIVVLVTETGFEWNGAPFRSLSGVAKAITGTGWNGPVFFGLKERRRK